ncbi:xylulose kinase 2-like isoform X2 [Wolffia australiana]
MAFPFPDDALFLGFDSSTQSLKVTVLDSRLVIVTSEIIRFDIDLPHYKTKDGVYRDPSGNGRIVSPTLMWIEALDLLLDKLKAKNFDFSRVLAISGSGQQHGSVYWKKGSSAILSSLNPQHTLLSQLSDAFSTKESPIWMDSSTTKQCREIEKAVGGPMVLSKLTGSRAYERFTGPQIRKMFESRINVYKETERISLVSSFMGSLMIGGYAAIDETDAAGMNLMDYKERIWSKIALQATAPDLEEKLGKLAPAHAVAGQISPYFVERFKFKRSCQVIQWSGDNPNSLAGLSLDSPGDLAISLGTSDTIFGITNQPEPSLEGNIFPNPIDPACYMVMLCYKNGSLTREDIRNQFAGASWDVFNEYLDNTSPLNDGKLGFYYNEREILPPVPAGYHRFLVDVDSGDERPVEHFDAPGEVRAVVEGQLLSMRAHAERFGLPVPPRRVVATGGASANDSILRIVAAVFGCDVYTVQRPDSASLGAALRAAHGWLCNKEDTFVPIAKLCAEGSTLAPKLAMPAGGECKFSAYTQLIKKRMEIEVQLVNKEWNSIFY